MSELSTFWSWFIIGLTVFGIVFCFALVYWMAQLKTKKGQVVKTMGHVWDEDLEEYNNPLPGWWLKLFYLTIVFAVAYLALYPGLGSFPGLLKWTQVGQYEKEVKSADERFGPLYEKYQSTDLGALAQDTEAVKVGERLFATYCTACHGADARGGRGYPNLRDGDWLYGGAPDMIKASIMHGRSGTMPAWGAALGHDGTVSVAEYVLSLSGRQHNASSAQAGKVKFDQMCAGCHMPDGKGNQAIGAPNLTDNVWLYGGSQAAIMKSIGEGRVGRMPAHAEFLGEAKVHLLSAYVFNLSSQEKDQAK